MLIEREYEYKPSWWIILLGGAMFGFATVFFVYRAFSNDRGLIINRVIELSESSATIFYWVFAFLSLCFVLTVIAITYHRLKFHQRLAFTDSELIVPASRWSAAEKSIKYADVSSLSVMEISGQKFLYVYHSGEKYIVNAALLSSKKTFEEIVDLLAKKTGK